MVASWDERIERHRRVAGALSPLTDIELLDLLDAAPVVGTGIGGARQEITIDGVTVFVKRVRLTELEGRPGNVRSTANLFGLPVWCQYGVGSPSFGVWREVAAHEMTTGWVTAGRSASFPLLHHWRRLDGPAPGPIPDELADVDRAVDYWHGSVAVRQRIDALIDSRETVTLFVEHLPHDLPEWLTEQVEAGGDQAGLAIVRAERALRADVGFMNDAGLFHFDAHLDNILTDGAQLFLADYGLATSASFELSAEEAAFVQANLTHDRSHTITRLVDWLVTTLTNVPDWMARDEFVRRVATRHLPLDLLPSAAAVIERYAPVAVVINEFYRRLHLEDRRTPYPAADVGRAWDLVSQSPA